MIYDRDIRWQRRCIFALILLNAIGMVSMAILHQWFVAFAYGVWATCCTVQLGVLRIQQVTRDMGRVIEAGLHGFRREIEKGEI